LPAYAQDASQPSAIAPNYSDPRERIAALDVSGFPRIRFLTTVDFPPFSFLDQTGRLSGFHVDLARAICTELDRLDACQIQALPFSELRSALEGDLGEAAIAGIAATAQSRQVFRFSRPYLELPARFIVRRDRRFSEPAGQALAGRQIGVLAGSAHEAMLRTVFPDLRPVTFSRAEWLFAALTKGSLDGIFADGVQLSFWLSSPAADGCCSFLDGPFLSIDFLGEGLAIAVAPEDQILVDAFDHAISRLNRNGRFAELYLRWFPNGLY